jgi:hypothetical protein
MRRLFLNRSEPSDRIVTTGPSRFQPPEVLRSDDVGVGAGIQKDRCRTTVAEPMVETRAELPFIGDQVVCLDGNRVSAKHAVSENVDRHVATFHGILLVSPKFTGSLLESRIASATVIIEMVMESQQHAISRAMLGLVPHSL